uniref:Lipocalin/cytosolic fatty-acid binding domain-containing protein n=1 Tax=Aureoumbra lagunensis TaxID=44058 RepID=A0A7S3NPM7_9STRA|mmetsp:Transcript_17956/g.23394  ORF Transcript_17956/g.23394 Transcript_17956/m.23394 type:complete len:188 (+) Transcript_17956:101-664(+)
MGSTSSKPALKPMARVDIKKMLGAWYVIGFCPLWLEKDAYNAREIYTAGKKPGLIDVSYTFTPGGFDTPVKSLPQRGVQWYDDKPDSWKIQLLGPITMPYIMIKASDPMALDNEDAWFVVGWRSRAYCWVMARKPTMDDALLEEIKTSLVNDHQYPSDLPNFKKVPHNWQLVDGNLERVITSSSPTS